MQIKTWLLCRWAQLSGSGAIAAPSDSQWTWTDSGGGQALAAIVSKQCPTGADGFQLGAIASPGDPTSNIVGTAACNSAGISGTFNFGDTALAKIRWTLGGVPVSGWSIQKSVAIVLDPAVQAYINNINAVLGLGPLDTTSTNALDAFVKGLRADNIWDSMIEINCVLNVPTAGDPLTLSMSLLKVGPLGAPSNGFIWTRSGFLLANLTANGLIGVPANSSVAFTSMVPNGTFPSSTDVGLSVYVSQISATASTVEIGTYNTTNTADIYLTVNNGGNTQSACWNDAGDTISVAAPNLGGFYSLSRTANNNFQIYFANSTNAFASIALNSNVLASAFFGTRAIVAWAFQVGSGNIVESTDRRLSFIAAHRGLTALQTKALFNRVQTLRTALGGGFV